MLLTVTNQKGGVGKTTLVWHLAQLAAESQTVLVVDLDTQGNASWVMTGDETIASSRGGAAALFEEGAKLEYRVGPRDNIAVLHGNQHLDGVDEQCSVRDALRRREEIRAALAFDVVIFDTPPALGIRQVAPLLWSDKVVVPVVADIFCAQALTNTKELIEQARRSNRALDYQLVVNRFQDRARVQKAVVKMLEGREEHAVVRPYLRDRAAVAQAMGARLPVWEYARAAAETKNEWREVCGRLL